MAAKQPCAKQESWVWKVRDYADPISYVVSTSPLEFSASANNCYDSSNFGTFANDLTTVLNEMFQGNMDADAAMEYVKKNLDDYMSTLN